MYVTTGCANFKDCASPWALLPRTGGEVAERWLMRRSTTDAGKHDGERGGLAASHEDHGGGKAAGE